MATLPPDSTVRRLKSDRSSPRRLIDWFSASQTAQSGLWSLVIRVALAGFTFVGTALLARLLGPAGFGIYSFTLALATLISVPTQFGLPTLLVRETARGMAHQDHGIVRGAWIWAGRITVFTSMGITVVAAVGLLLSRKTVPTERLATYAWAVILIPLVALGNLRGAALRGLQRIVQGQLPELVFRPGLLVVMLAAVAVFAPKSLSAPEAMALNVGAAGLAFAIGAWLLWRATPDGVWAARPRFEGRAWLKSTFPLALIQQMQVVNRQASILLLGLFMADSDIGIYRVATQVSLLAAFGLQAANNVVGPKFARSYAKGDMEGIQRLATKSARAILAFNVLVTLAFIFLGKPFLRIVFGPEYLLAYLAIVILLGGQLANSAAGSVGNLLNMTGHEKETAKGMLVSALCNVVLNLLLIPWLGIVGSAIATAASLVVWNAVLWLAVRRHLGVNSVAFARL